MAGSDDGEYCATGLAIFGLHRVNCRFQLSATHHTSCMKGENNAKQKSISVDGTTE